MVLEENEENKRPPPFLEPLLAEFLNVIPGKIPHDLFPMRDIQHCIDLVPSFVIPN